MKALKFIELNQGKYFDELPKETQELVKDLILKAADSRSGPDGYKSDQDALSSLSCRRVDGFIPASDNLGGFRYQNFCTLMDYWGGGYNVAHKEAKKEIQRQIDYSLKCAADQFKKNKAKELEERKISSAQVDLNTLFQLGHDDLAEEFTEYEYENLNDDNSSIMHEFRFLFHGVNDEGKFYASVSAAVNTEGPYHRSHIAWASGVFCEGAKEIEITWRTDKQLKIALEKALKQCSREIF